MRGHEAGALRLQWQAIRLGCRTEKGSGVQQIPAIARRTTLSVHPSGVGEKSPAKALQADADNGKGEGGNRAPGREKKKGLQNERVKTWERRAGAEGVRFSHFTETGRTGGGLSKTIMNAVKKKREKMKREKKNLRGG